jgi:two-component system, NtrC family, nitrogen regulation sensor histidine kinase GlnL
MKPRKTSQAAKASLPPKASLAQLSEAFGIDAESGLLDLLPQPFLIIALDNTVAFANAEAEAFFRQSAAGMGRHRLDEVLAPGHPLIGLVTKVRDSGASINEYGLDLSSPRTGEHPLVDVFAKCVTAMPGVVALLLVERTMAHMIERQLSHRTSARAVTGLAAMLAHEIKNPLSGIRGAAQLLSSDVDDDGRQLTTLICDETDRICALVDRMGAFGNVAPADTHPINIHSVLDHVKQLARAGFARGVEISEAYDPSLPPLLGNRDRLVQAILNLVKNAAEAINPDMRGAKPDGRIVLHTGYRPVMRMARPGGGTRIALPLMVAVEDNGPGIPEAIRSSLFEPFVTTKVSGSGLGLAMVATVVAEHGGVIRVERERGHTVFRMFFPVAPATSDDATSNEKSANDRPTRHSSSGS